MMATKAKTNKAIGLLRLIFLSMLILIFALASPLQASASSPPEFRLDMKSLNLQKGVSATLTVSLINAQDARITGIEGLENFDILSQNQSSSTSIINNVITSQLDIIYTIMPKTEGTFSLRATINYSGQNYETNTLSVNVTAAAQNWGAADDGTGTGTSAGAYPDIFVKTNLSHSEAYLGEKIILIYELYARISVESCGFTDYLAIDGMIVKDMTENQIGSEPVYIDGEQYNKYDVKKLVIDAIKPGVYEIQSFNLQANVMDADDMGMGRTRDPFGFGAFGMFGVTTTKYLLTDEAELLIKPLPTEGKPSGFSGIVGELSLDGQYSRTEMDYGDSLTLRATVGGDCNLDGIDSIIGDSVEGLTIYENMKNADEYLTGNRYNAAKTFEAIIIPERMGEIDVPAITISYFNPATEKYEVAEIEGLTLTINGGAGQPAYNSSGQIDGNQPGGNQPGGNFAEGSGAPAKETILVNQVNYSGKTGNYIVLQFRKETLYIAAVALVCLIIFLGVLLWYLLRRKKQDATLRTIYKQLLATDDINEIYSHFNSMVKHRFKISLKTNSRDTIMNTIPDGALASKIIGIMGYVEDSGAGSADENGAQHLKNDIKEIYKTALSM